MKEPIFKIVRRDGTTDIEISDGVYQMDGLVTISNGQIYSIDNSTWEKQGVPKK